LFCFVWHCLLSLPFLVIAHQPANQHLAVDWFDHTYLHLPAYLLSRLPAWLPGWLVGCVACVGMFSSMAMAQSQAAMADYSRNNTTPNHELFEMVRMLSVSSTMPTENEEHYSLHETATSSSSATAAAAAAAGSGGGSAAAAASASGSAASNAPAKATEPKRSFFRFKKTPPVASSSQAAASTQHDVSGSGGNVGGGSASGAGAVGGSSSGSSGSSMCHSPVIVSAAVSGTANYYFVSLFISNGFFVFRYARSIYRHCITIAAALTYHLFVGVCVCMMQLAMSEWKMHQSSSISDGLVIVTSTSSRWHSTMNRAGSCA
jgi:hypothetical protein